MGAILTVAMMFEHFGWADDAKRIDDAVRVALREGKTAQELGGTLGTREVGEWVANSVAKGS
jgi:3-isopropylmalate dehydrogenase